jgi:hypothetical protein
LLFAAAAHLLEADCHEQRGRPMKATKPKVVVDFEQARASILENVRKGGIKGAGVVAKKPVLTANRAVFDEALTVLESEGAIFVDRSKTKPKYYLKEFAPSHREAILKRLRMAEAKGSAALYTAKTSADKRLAIENDAAALESEGAIVIDRNGTKPKYYLREFAPELPSLEGVCARLEEFATTKFPQLLSEGEFKKALDKAELTLFDRARYWLETQREIVRFQHGKSSLFASARALRGALGGESAAALEPTSTLEPTALSGEAGGGRIREAYRVLVAQTGFPSVKIAALQRESGAPLPVLQQWLRDEYQQGRAVLSFGDWSLSDEPTRAAALELRGERYLLVKLLQ